MVFSSLLFLTLFLPLTVFVYYLLPNRWKNLHLLIVSLIFYAWGEPANIILMAVTTVYIWALTVWMQRCMERGNVRLAKILLWLSVVFSLGTLAYYKYFGFILENIPFLKNLPVTAPALPIGISFYTFQALSYVVDVYRGEVKAQKSWVNFAMYISMFPQLIAGPIVRYSDVEKQLEERKHTTSDMYCGIRRFTLGLGKKVLLANQIGILWDEISGLHQLSTVGAWLGAVAFAFQIYFDFSAYSDMAIGLGRMFGFHFTENFRYPYQSKSITEFWRRWHITLGTWFREYVYIPLGGNRKGKARMVLNLLAVWALTGLWHGAAWQFLLWGLYYFLFLTVEKFFLLEKMERWPKFCQGLYTMIAVLFGWVIFACPDLCSAGTFYKAMLGIGVPFVDGAAKFYMSGAWLMLIVLALGATGLPKHMMLKMRKMVGKRAFEWISYGGIAVILIAAISFLVADSYNPFLYFRF